MTVLGLDQDADALAAARRRLARFGDRVATVHGRFDRLPEVLREHGVDELSGALFDLGVSSPQLDRADRGFSYRNDGPLDMRMDRSQPLTAADVVNGYDVDELARIIRRYGDERFAGRIARAIVAARPLHTTTELAAVGHRRPSRRRPAGTVATPPSARSRRSASRSTTSCDVLPDAIDSAIDATRPGGRVAVLTYHSGEDRIVKDRFRGGPRRVRLPARAAVRLRGACAGAPGPGARGRRPMPTPRPTAAPGRRACAWSRSWRSAHAVSAQPMRRIDAPRRQHSGPLPRKPRGRFRGRRARSTERLDAHAAGRHRRCSRCVRCCASCPAGASPPTRPRSRSW